MKTVEELTKFAREFLRKEYNEELPFDVTINGRLKTTLGRYDFYRSMNGKIVPRAVMLSRQLIEYGTTATIESVLKHELIHLAVSRMGLPFNDGDEEFESELRKHGAHSTREIRLGVYISYRCSDCESQCGTFYGSKNMNKYISSCCKAELEAYKEIICDGESMKEYELVGVL